MTDIRCVVGVACALAVISISQFAAAQETPAGSSSVDQALKDAQAQIDDLTKKLDASEQARSVSAGILEPIYMLAERIAFPAFYWVAFALMATGVISFLLQLVIAKLVVLSKMSFSLTEILSDALGLAISVIGLVLTTQAAAENSNFTKSPAAVLSASAVGVLAGFLFYRWAQRQEVAAITGRRAGNVENTKPARS